MEAPFTEEQVRNLNEYQRSGLLHPFTCGQRGEHPENAGILIATQAGWYCPAEGCDYTQSWAWGSMTDGSVVNAAREQFRGLGFGEL